MKSKVFYIPNAPRPNAHVPQAVIVGNLIFVSGKAGIDGATGYLVDGGYEAQVQQSFNNVKTILEDAGSSMNNVVKVAVFVVSDTEFSVTNRIYSDFSNTKLIPVAHPGVCHFRASIFNGMHRYNLI